MTFDPIRLSHGIKQINESIGSTRIYTVVGERLVKTLGFDFGSVYTKGLLLEDGKVSSLMLYRRKSSDDLGAICAFLGDIERQFPGESFKIGLTGISGSSAWNARGQLLVNAIIAVAVGARQLGFNGCQIVEIGGQNAKFIVLDRDSKGTIKEFSMNDACAAGSGMFIEQQAGRLKLSIDELSKIGGCCEKNLTIAGRCAVFAKSDMIHMQQKGENVAELAGAMCRAICRNFQAMLLKGRDLEPPVFIAGGCAANSGIIKAFKEIPVLHDPQSVVVSPFPGLEGAVGAAYLAEQSDAEQLTPAIIAEILRDLSVSRAGEMVALPALKRVAVTRLHEPDEIFHLPMAGYLGVDIGSVSTDLAVIAANGELISSVYLPTRGRPVEVLKEGLAIIKSRFAGGLKVLGCGTTGSGRHLAGKILGADIVKNEITCQFLGIQHYFDDIDTIFEIGGQDSKFISVRDNCVSDFLMNKVCAAGTGSFLEEQAAEMGIDIIGEFEELAFAGLSPADLGSHCTVFMETEVCNALQQGKDLADICAGLAYSIVRNYLEKVVGNRPIGQKVAFQGGVASNSAVVAAFEQILQQPVFVMPYNRISGAIGAAIAAKSYIGVAPSGFRGLDCTDDAKITTFHCHQCSNNCEVSLIEQGGCKIYYGDTCERYTSSGGLMAAECRIPNLAAEYVNGCEAYFTAHLSQAVKIGVPRASTLMGYLPFWGTFFTELGCAAILSEQTSAEILTQGLKHLPASVCLPVKLMAGHVVSLQSARPDFIFLPSIMRLPGSDNEHSYACPYAMALPFMVNVRSGPRILSPVLSMNDEDSFVEGFSVCLPDLMVSEDRVRSAYRAAMRENHAFVEKMRRKAAVLLAAGEYSHVFGVIGKPYNLFDSYLNLGLFERLRRLGILAIPLSLLPLKVDDCACLLPWELSAEVFRAASACAATENIFPLLTSNYGCALDAFTFRQLEPWLQNKPHLVVEFDEHRGEAGLMTRLEAFIDQLNNVGQRRYEVREPACLPASVAMIPEKTAPVFMPYWSDYVYAYAGIWEHVGYNVEILPLPEPNIRLLGEKYSLGKECSPYAMVVGDLIQLHHANPERELVYHFPSVTFPCLLTQYGNNIQLLLRELGIRNIRLSSLTGTDLTRAFGLSEMQLLYEGLLAIDALVKASCETRAYELNPGMTSELHRQSLLQIRKGVASGNVVPALDRALAAFAKVPVDRSRSRPLVGIAGDLYTKVNEVANNNLYEWLERQGFEVWPSPSQIDLLDCGIASSFLHSLSRFDLGDILVSGTIALRAMFGAWKLRNAAGRRVLRMHEPGYREMLRLAKPYMSNIQHELLLVNIAKIVDFAERGADGIINAICFNCMVGNASEAIIEKIRHDHQSLPIITAVFAGNDNPGRQMQLDTFACQVREHHNNRRAGQIC